MKTCNKCKNNAVWVEYNTFQYWYCRTCKKELQLETITIDTNTISQNEIDSLRGQVFDSDIILKPNPCSPKNKNWSSKQKGIYLEHLNGELVFAPFIFEMSFK